MLDLYYLREGPLPDTCEDIGRLIRMRDNLGEIRAVLKEFFEPCPEGWRHARCDAEIQRMQDKQAKAKASAAASVNARKSKTEPKANERSTNVQRTFNERSTNVELPTPTPIPIYSVAKATDASVVQTKDELWKAGKSLLQSQGMPLSQCGSFVGKLVKDYGDSIVIDAVRQAVYERPADAASYLKAFCQQRYGERKKPNKQQQLEDRNDAVLAEFLKEKGAINAD